MGRDLSQDGMFRGAKGLSTADPGKVQPRGTSAARGLAGIPRLAPWTRIESLAMHVRIEKVGQVQS